ncbi:MAG: PDZ domain-containing protein [Planctomycetes bacterium]|nr:PDZ domain-containing protein [Planctomycetota bacterium]
MKFLRNHALSILVVAVVVGFAALASIPLVSCNTSGSQSPAYAKDGFVAADGGKGSPYDGEKSVAIEPSAPASRQWSAYEVERELRADGRANHDPRLARLKDGDELVLIPKLGETATAGERAKARAMSIKVDEPTEGSLFAKRGTETVGQFPLKHTAVKAEVSGYLGATNVTQTFTNPFNEVIEAVYTFPLPNNAAINDFLMVIGDRRIRGMIRPRAEAEQIYKEARSRGVTASLLTQERPNIFTQNVANIAIGGQVDISITYFETLKYEDGRYEYSFPMVVAPRYIPGKSVETVPVSGVDKEVPVGGQGTSAPTTRVPDAEKITPPLIPEGMRSGHDISLTLDVDAGLPLDFSKLEPVTHKVHAERVSNTRFVARLDDLDNIPNRDFVFRWTLSVEKPTVGLLTHAGDSGKFFTMMLQPQLHPAEADITPREITFLIDTSGSQHGKPLEMSQDITQRALDGLRAEDTFNVFFFAGGNGQLWDAPRPRTAENVSIAKEYVKSLKGGGGTEMLAGLKRALRARHDPKFLQMYAFFTDGQIGDEEAILKTIKEEKNGARFFCFGTGGSVNRYLCDGISEHGDGRTIYCIPREQSQTEKATALFFQSIDAPVLCDISIDYNGLPMTDVYPAQVKDLFAGQPIMLKGRYSKGARGTLFVNGRIGARKVSIPVEVNLPEKEPRNECLAPIWARARIAELSGDMIGKPAEEQKPIIEQITNLACEFRLMSQYTAFVAVDESRIVGDGKPLKVMQPVELPEGTTHDQFEGGAANARSINAWGITVAQNKQGGVAIVAVNKDGAADKAGVAVGKLVASIDGVAVTGVNHLESLLLQTSGKETVVGLLNPGAEATNIAKVKLPRP